MILTVSYFSLPSFTREKFFKSYSDMMDNYVSFKMKTNPGSRFVITGEGKYMLLIKD